MAVVVNGKQFVTLSDEFFVNGAKVYAAYANGVQVYPTGPAGIRIITPPTKTNYAEGDTIDFTGIVVKLDDGMGGVYTDSRYPDGIIPFEELVFPVTIAKSSSDVARSSVLNESWFPSGSVSFGHSGYAGPIGGIYSPQGQPKYVFSRTVAVTNVYMEYLGTLETWFWSYYGVAASSEPFEFDEFDRFHEPTHHESSTYTANGKTVYYAAYGNGGWVDDNIPISEGVYNGFPDTLPSITFTYASTAWTIIYGEISEGDGKIPVNWVSPYDGRMFEDSFEITVSAAVEGGNDGGFIGGGGGDF